MQAYREHKCPHPTASDAGTTRHCIFAQHARALYPHAHTACSTQPPDARVAQSTHLTGWLRPMCICWQGAAQLTHNILMWPLTKDCPCVLPRSQAHDSLHSPPTTLNTTCFAWDVGSLQHPAKFNGCVVQQVMVQQLTLCHKMTLWQAHHAHDTATAHLIHMPEHATVQHASKPTATNVAHCSVAA